MSRRGGDQLGPGGGAEGGKGRRVHGGRKCLCEGWGRKGPVVEMGRGSPEPQTGHSFQALGIGSCLWKREKAEDKPWGLPLPSSCGDPQG